MKYALKKFRLQEVEIEPNIIQYRFVRQCAINYITRYIYFDTKILIRFLQTLYHVYFDRQLLHANAKIIFQTTFSLAKKFTSLFKSDNVKLEVVSL